MAGKPPQLLVQDYRLAETPVAPSVTTATTHTLLVVIPTEARANLPRRRGSPPQFSLFAKITKHRNGFTTEPATSAFNFLPGPQIIARRVPRSAYLRSGRFCRSSTHNPAQRENSIRNAGSQTRPPLPLPTLECGGSAAFCAPHAPRTPPAPQNQPFRGDDSHMFWVIKVSTAVILCIQDGRNNRQTLGRRLPGTP